MKKLRIVEQENIYLKDALSNRQIYVARRFEKIRESRSKNKAGGAHIWAIWML